MFQRLLVSWGQQKAKNAQSWPQLFWALTPKHALSCELPLWPEISLEILLVWPEVDDKFCHSGHVHSHDFCTYRQLVAEKLYLM
jgi:hypothetical protein